VLSARGLEKRYGPTTALDGCDLAVERGRLVGFLGPNGAGKTTLMRAVFGLVELDAGQVTWDGETVSTAQRVRFGYMPEQRGLYPKMRVVDQLGHLGRLHGLDRAEGQRRAHRWLDVLGLAERAQDPLEALSHGNQQRVQLAAALVHDPELLVLDEPFSGLDPLGVETMGAVLRERQEAGAAIVFSSHQLDLVQSLCDDVVVISEGRDILAGTLDELRSASGSHRVELAFDEPVGWDPAREVAGVEVLEVAPTTMRLLVPAGTDPSALLASARASGQVREFSFGPPTLSELFREAVRG
jgi:ABC-2 type transport system ATP-binding protein